MALRSTEELAPVPPGTKRRPLSRTSVRCAPSPLRLMRVDPSPPLLACVLMALDLNSQSLQDVSDRRQAPRTLISSRDMTMTGAGVRSS